MVLDFVDPRERIQMPARARHSWAGLLEKQRSVADQIEVGEAQNAVLDPRPTALLVVVVYRSSLARLPADRKKLEAVGSVDKISHVVGGVEV